jgi:hypothetical protein
MLRKVGPVFAVESIVTIPAAMKTVILMLSLALLALPGVSGQKMYEVKYPSEADLKVYRVTYESQCDLKVFLVKYESQADEPGKWYFVKYPSRADKKVYFVDYESQADLKIFVVKYESGAGWETHGKRHLLCQHPTERNSP